MCNLIDSVMMNRILKWLLEFMEPLLKHHFCAMLLDLSETLLIMLYSSGIYIPFLIWAPKA